MYKHRDFNVLGADAKGLQEAGQRHAYHHPASTPPRLIPNGELEDKTKADGGGLIATWRGERLYIKPQNLFQGQKELTAFTVLGSLGFRVPGVDVVKGDTRPVLANRSLSTRNGIVTPYYSLPEPSKEHTVEDVDALPDFSLAWEQDMLDSADQRLAAALINSQNRHSGNILRDEHNRRWDIDLGAYSLNPDGDGGDSVYVDWLRGLWPDQAAQIASNFSEVIAAHRQAGMDITSLVETTKYLTSDKAVGAFDWLRECDTSPYYEFGFIQVHEGVVHSLKQLRDFLTEVVCEYTQCIPGEGEC